MANTEDVEVFRVRIDAEGQTVAELRESLKGLKKDVENAEIGTEEYTEAVKALGAQQDLLKEVMYQQRAAADGVTESYNSLSAEMGRLKVAQKALDISTEEGMAQWQAYAKEINTINDRLKDLDASNGVFSRNVGDYANQVLKGFKDIAKDMPSWTSGIKKGVDDVSKSFGLLATNPVIGIASLLAPVVTEIARGVQDNAGAAEALRKVLDALRPVMNVAAGILEKIVGWVSGLVSRLGDLAGESAGTFQTIVTGAVGVGNALLQFLLTPIRTVIEAVKGLGTAMRDVLSGQFKAAAEDAKTALAGIGDAFMNGFAFKANFEAGQAIGEQFAAGLRSPKTKATAAAAVKEVVEAAAADGLAQADIDKALAEADKKADAARRKRLEERKMVDEWFADEDAALAAEINAIIDEQIAHDNEASRKAEENAKTRVDTLRAAAATTSNILSTLADMFDANAASDEKATRQGKALRIAAATIDMLQGAVTAYSAAQSLGVPAGPIVGAANAAAVIAAGTANIAKIRATQVDRNGTPAPAAALAVSPVVSAPLQDYAPPEQLRTITSASEEDRLNRMAGPQRVYILQSDIEAAGRAAKVQVDESTF
ncbi:MAG: hypothetical protein IJ654_05350 [Bacteroidales bacterium]|nr:hypothetical protein [Bacteroidales bacterium]